MEEDRKVKIMRDVAAKFSEEFIDYVVIGRVSEGLVWRYSDRSFALGAMHRLGTRLGTEDVFLVPRPEQEV